MNTEVIYRELVQFDVEVKDQNEFFEKTAAMLCEKGYVKPSYIDAVKLRESRYPTGLPTEPYPVAIPHAEAEHIIKPFIALARLKNPVRWDEMGTDPGESELQVKLIFALGFQKGNDQIDILQMLAEKFSNADLMNPLLEAETPDEYHRLVINMLETEN